MAKEANTPKAINIVRPGHSITSAPKFQVFSPLRNNAKPPSDIHKPKVMTTAQISLNDRPGLALFAPQNQKHSLHVPCDSFHRQSVSPPKRIPPVIFSATSLNATSHVPNGPYVGRNATKSQLSIQRSVSRTSSFSSNRSDSSVGLASVHPDHSRGSNSHYPHSNSDLNTIRRPPGIVISSDITYNEPSSRNVHGPIAENVIDDDRRPHNYDISTNVEEDTSSEPGSLSISEKSDGQSSFDSDEEDVEDGSRNDMLEEEEEEDHEEAPINEARVNRKIADLEISNQSLLAVNTMLESTVRKQAMQILELQRSKASTDFLDVQRTNQDNIEDNDLIVAQGEEDEQFQRISSIIDRLIEQAQSAIDYKISNAGRVLSLYDQSEDEILGSSSTLSLTGTDADEEEDTTRDSSASSSVNSSVPKRVVPDSPLQQRPHHQQRRSHNLSRQSISSHNLGPPPTSRDVLPSKSTAIKPNLSPKLPTTSTRKMAGTNANRNTNNSRKSKPRGFHQGKVHVK